jgi:hypothetical protein
MKVIQPFIKIKIVRNEGNDEQVRIWEETVIACFKVLSWHLPEGTVKNL